MHGGDESRGAWSKALGTGIEGFANVYELKPDVVYYRVIELRHSVAVSPPRTWEFPHIQAGDKSGHIDDSARHAIGNLLISIWPPAKIGDRLRKMGEQDFRIFNVGAPQLDNIVDKDYTADSVKIVTGWTCPILIF